MVQQAYDRASKISDDVYVVTEASHSDDLRRQLPELAKEKFLIEPGRRGTANCILFALDYIARHHDHDEPISFIHSDHHVRDVKRFIDSFNVAGQVSAQNKEIALIGIEPTFPSTGFGYIGRGSRAGTDTYVYSVKSFKEKPEYHVAVEYVKSGNYLWNCGYFVGSVNVFSDEIAAVSPELKGNYEQLSRIEEFAGDEYNKTYLSFDTQVVDVALIEKSRRLTVVAASFDWMDVGSFKDLHDVVLKDEKENYFSGSSIYDIETENAYVRNEEAGKPIVVIGLDNVVVVNTPDGLLVSRKDLSPQVGVVAKKINANE